MVFIMGGMGWDGKGKGKGRDGKGREGKERKGKGREGKGREGKGRNCCYLNYSLHYTLFNSFFPSQN